MNFRNYSSDSPLEDSKFDQFNRYPFAQRVASVISKRSDPSSIVIGIHGIWGEGKTSVFNFIENELLDEQDVVCLKFNPWRFGNEDQMLINFFNDLATAVDKSIISGKEKIGDLISSYGKPFASIIGRGEAAEGLASLFSKADIEELRERIEGLLEKEKKRIVILIDDIDRLEKDEIYAVFRLVKLTADFKYTAYILAFDQNVVISALQERYGKGADSKVGSSFLEKIIQVPLQLPTVNREDLRSFYLNEINQMIDSLNIEISEMEGREFVKNFYKGLEPHLKTPRQAKLYSNILMFSLPILQDEVNIVDLMLIEGIKVFLPDVYSLIKNHKKIFLENEPVSPDYNKRQIEIEKRKDRIEEVLSEYLNEDKEGIIDLLSFLFPKLDSVFGNSHYGREWEAKWEEEQRISSPQYFQRYFDYAINNRDVSDILINELVTYSESNSAIDTSDRIKEVITDKNVESFISKLRTKSRILSTLQKETLSLSIAKLGNWLPNPVMMFSYATPFSQAAIFIGNCIEKIGNEEKQFEVASKVICESDSVSFATECFSWFTKNTESQPNPQGLSIKNQERLANILAERISLEFKNVKNIEVSKFNNLTTLIFIWSKYGEELDASNWITEKIKSDIEFLFIFVESYTGLTSGSFGTKRSEFNTENYKAIKKIIDPSLIYQKIKETTKHEKSIENYFETNDISKYEDLAREFSRVHEEMEDDKNIN